MPTDSGLFSSPRERRLWICVGLVQGAILATLGVMPLVADVLRERALIDSLFGYGALLILAALLAVGLRLRFGVLEIGAVLGILAVYLLAFVRFSLPEERTHLLEYSVVAILLHEALRERASNGRLGVSPVLLALLLTALLGCFDECVQAILPNRYFDWRDIVFNLLAAVLGVASGVVFLMIRRLRERTR